MPIRYLWFPDSAGTLQVGVPISTISAGAWIAVGAATIHEALGSPRNDSTYAQTTEPSTMEVGITVLEDPVTGDKTVSYTLEGTGIEACDVLLRENGTTTVQTWNHTDTGTLTLYEQTVTGTITAPGALSLRFEGA